jgi:hypothetical protein
MKLYPKKIGSLEALRREKIRLRYERLNTKASDLNPIAEIGRGRISGAAKSGILGTVMALMTSTSQMQTVLALGEPLLKLLGKRRAKARERRYAAGLPKKKSVIKKVFTEIAVAFIIGKAVQVSIEAVRLYRRRQKEKKLRLSTSAI